ncbi:MAG: class I SAM-dependent methyltransferase [Anaerolineaceae bacterium]
MTTSENEQAIKQEVQSFYDRVGWKEVSEGVYQNARFEDLRPVSKEYIHRCHLRAGSFLTKNGRFLLDAGSGPIQYPEYLTYSEGYSYRVCVDISAVALDEARRRIGSRGMFIVADVSALPFRKEVFDGVVSLHTLHHLPIGNQQSGYLELWRVLASGRNAVIVNGWTDAPLMRWLEFLVKIMERVQSRKDNRKQQYTSIEADQKKTEPVEEPAGTYVQKFTPARLKEILGERIPYDIRCWRSVSVRFLRAVIHPRLAGRLSLRLLFWLEDHFAHFFGVTGQYPLIILKKPE